MIKDKNKRQKPDSKKANNTDANSSSDEVPLVKKSGSRKDRKTDIAADSSSDDEPLSKKVVAKKDEDSSNDEDVDSSKTGSTNVDDQVAKVDKNDKDPDADSSTDDEPLSKTADLKKANVKESERDSSSSDEEPLSKKGAKEKQEKKIDASDNQPAPRHRTESSSSSGVSDISLIDDTKEGAEKTKEKSTKKESAKKTKKQTSTATKKGVGRPKSTKLNSKKKDENQDEEKENQKGPDSKKKEKKKDAEDGGLVRLKKCVRAAGIHLNYVRLFEGIPKVRGFIVASAVLQIHFLASLWH